MAITQEELQNILKKSFPNAQMHITDTIGDGDHYALEIIDDSFKGKSLINQHKMVKEALKEVLQSNKLHAISIKTKAREY